MALITTPKEARELVRGIIDSQKVALGVKYIGVDDEKKLPHYPAVVVSAGPKEKSLHGTHTWMVTLRVIIWVYHADLSVGHRARSDADLDLASSIEAALEVDMEYDGQVIQGWVESQTGGVFQPRSNKGDLVVGSRLVWSCLTQERF